MKNQEHTPAPLKRGIRKVGYKKYINTPLFHFSKEELHKVS